MRLFSLITSSLEPLFRILGRKANPLTLNLRHFYATVSDMSSALNKSARTRSDSSIKDNGNKKDDGSELPAKKKVKLNGTLDGYFKVNPKPVSMRNAQDEDDNVKVPIEELVKEQKDKEHAALTHDIYEKGPLSPEQSSLVKEKALGAKLLKAVKSFSILDPEIGKSWFAALEGEFRKDYFAKLDKFVTGERQRSKVYPEQKNVWEWTKHCDIQDIKVVILGQDPYHGPNQAHGLCFSVKKGVQSPPSLVNIFKELKSDIPDFAIPNHGCLQGWTDEGVLLLNAVLTVEAAKANSHKDKGWENITNAVISWISKNSDSVVFLLWGAHAQKMATNVDKKKHHLLTTVHPSPLSAHRGFFGCKHFSTANELLKKAGKTPINWNNLY